MTNRLMISEVDRVEGYGVVIHFTDNTVSTFTAEELANMHAYRMLDDSSRFQAGVTGSRNRLEA